MTNKILFSIIVPFYDTIDYVKETIDSIAKQRKFDLNQIEVIIINDGSKYNLDFIYKKYHSKIHNLFIYKKPNGNWGSVINYVKANHLAKGKYLTILDSDDKFLPKTLYKVSKYINKNPDIITAKFYRWSSLTNKKKRILVHLLHSNKFYFGKKFNKKKHLLRTGYSFPLVKFYSKTLFYKTKFKLQENISFQDCVFFHSLNKKAKSWVFINKYLGLYRDDRVGSSSNTKWSIKRINAWIQTINNLDAIGATSNAYMYCIYTPFVKACKNFKIDKTIVLHKNIKVTYIPKILHPLARVVFRSRVKKMKKNQPIRLI